MRLTLTIPDAIADQYQTYVDRQGRPIEEVCATQLQRFSHLEPGQKAVVIRDNALVALDKKLGGRPIVDGPDLVDRVSRLASIAFCGLNLELSQNQLAEIAHRASRQGKSVEDLVREMFVVVIDQFFYTAGGGEAKVVPLVPPAPLVPATT